MLRDVLTGADPQVQAVQTVIGAVCPDILALQSIDYDHDLATLLALNAGVPAPCMPYPHLFALEPNTGRATGLDLNGDGYRGDPEDAQGFGAFAGQGGMALLSRWPVDRSAVVDLSALLWKEAPGATLPTHPNGDPFPTAEAQDVQRLSTTGHWAVPVVLPGGDRLTLQVFQAAPPVFDGPEDRNGLRNADELALWRHYLDGALGQAAPADGFVILGDFNNDPQDGEGRNPALHALLTDPRLQDPAPRSDGAVDAALAQAGTNVRHSGDAALDTADWPDDPGPGNLRVDYVLPSAELHILASGVFWPKARSVAGDLAATVAQASRHRLVWVRLLP